MKRLFLKEQKEEEKGKTKNEEEEGEINSLEFMIAGVHSIGVWENTEKIKISNQMLEISRFFSQKGKKVTNNLFIKIVMFVKP